MQFIKNSTANLYFLLLAIFLISSCTTAKKIAIHQPSTAVKNYPVGKPFVYNNKIIINGTIDAKEKLRLTTELSNYWDDSLQVRKKSKFGFFDGEHFLYTKIIDKPQFLIL